MSLTLLQVAVGGAIGSVARYLVTSGTARACGPGFPVGTLAVNVAGSLAIGALFVVLTREGRFSPLLLTGVLGGFTTFSAFSLDAFCLWERGAQGTAAAYVMASVILSLAALALGAILARGMMA